MRRSGIFSLIVYILYTLQAFALLFFFFEEFSGPDVTVTEGLSGLVVILGLFTVVGLVVLSLILLILKLLHMATRFPLFVIGCLLADIITICLFAPFVFADLFAVENLLDIACISIAVGSFISNVRSIR